MDLITKELLMGRESVKKLTQIIKIIKRITKRKEYTRRIIDVYYV